ncbi:MAG: Na+/H+ antiporter [Bacteroidetes bacterium]|nr:Na+/H+ antiporter [Bacteroidota bacterium]
MTGLFTIYLILILAILLLIMASERLRVASPIILLAGGLLLSLVPQLGVITIDPELIFMIFLPPLLYDAAWFTSWKELWKWRRVIGSFAFLIVILTSLFVAWVSSTLIPGFTMALGFLLGGIISPPDAVSATSVLKQVKVPRRLSSILEGESLLNDASGLIIFRYALIAVDTGRFVFHEAAFSFILLIVMGIATGVVIGLVFFALHRYLPTNTNTDIVLSLTTPYVMYIVAESLHFSGVLAVVSGGLFLSSRNHLFLNHRSRLRGLNVWSTLGFVLNGLIFLLIGLELPTIIRQLEPISLGEAIKYGALITVLLIAARLISTLGASVWTVFISRYIRTADNRPGWKGPVLLGWAGMRGVVSLAAALSIPLKLSNGQPFPQRNLILFITFVVIVLSILVQGLTLPWVVRLVKFEDPDHRMPVDEQERLVRERLAVFSSRFLEDHKEAGSNPYVQQLVARFRNEQLPINEDHKEDHELYYRVYMSLLEEQRLFLVELNKSDGIDEEVIRKYQGLVDLEEEKLTSKFEKEE